MTKYYVKGVCEIDFNNTIKGIKTELIRYASTLDCANVTWNGMIVKRIVRNGYAYDETACKFSAINGEVTFYK